MIKASRTKLGAKFSEAARQMWVLMAEKKWSAYDLARELGVPQGQVHSWLLGDRLPSLKHGLNIQDKLGLNPGLFFVKPRRVFVLPAARAAA